MWRWDFAQSKAGSEGADNAITVWAALRVGLQKVWRTEDAIKASGKTLFVQWVERACVCVPEAALDQQISESAPWNLLS